MGRFLGVLLLSSFVLYLLPYWIVRLPGYSRFSYNPIGQQMDYVFATAGIDADVVILGESSSLFGLQPGLISSDLHGAKVINLANFYSSLRSVGVPELEAYLRHNKRPKLLVFYTSAWDTNFEEKFPGLHLFEGEEVLLRHGSLADIASYAARNPVSTAEFPLNWYIYTQTTHHVGVTNPPPVALDGHADGDAVTFLKADCRLPQGLIQQTESSASVQKLLVRFKDAADHVIYYPAPVPSCPGLLGQIHTPFATLGTQPPHVLPAGLFKADFAYTHLEPKVGAPAASHLFAHDIAPLLQTR